MLPHRPMAQRVRLGEFLVKAGILDEATLRSALAEQKVRGGTIADVLVARGDLDEGTVARALARSLGLGRAALGPVGFSSLRPELCRRFDPVEAREGRYCPESYDAERGVLRVAMVDPTAGERLDEIGRRAGCPVEPTVAGPAEVDRAIERLFYGSVPRPAPPGPAARAPVAPGPKSSGQHERFPALETPPSRPDLGFGPEPTLGGSDPAAAAAKLEAAQKRQNRAIRAMLEMLIERGVFTEDEFRDRLGTGRTRR